MSIINYVYKSKIYKQLDCYNSIILNILLKFNKDHQGHSILEKQYNQMIQHEQQKYLQLINQLQNQLINKIQKIANKLKQTGKMYRSINSTQYLNKTQTHSRVRMGDSRSLRGNSPSPNHTYSHININTIRNLNAGNTQIGGETVDANLGSNVQTLTNTYSFTNIGNQNISTNSTYQLKNKSKEKEVSNMKNNKSTSKNKKNHSMSHINTSNNTSRSLLTNQGGSNFNSNANPGIGMNLTMPSIASNPVLNMHTNISPSYSNLATHPASYRTADILLNQSLIAKNKKLSVMMRTLHGYMTTVEEFDWIIRETQKIMANYIRLTLATGWDKQNYGARDNVIQNSNKKQASSNSKFTVAHKIQIQNIYNQLTKLINRFTGMDKKWIYEMTIPFKDKETKRFNNNFMNSSNSKGNIENYNILNFKKNQTIGSFKCMETENEDDAILGYIHTDFSKIKLPQTIKQNYPEEEKDSIQNSRHSPISQTQPISLSCISSSIPTIPLSMQAVPETVQNMQVTIHQYESTLQTLKFQLDQEKLDKNTIRDRMQRNIQQLQNKLQQAHREWEAFKIVVKEATRKSKYYLKKFVNQLGNTQNDIMGIESDGNTQQQQVEQECQKLLQIFDELFKVQNKLDRKVLNNNNISELQHLKQQKIKQLINVEQKLRQKYKQLQRIQAKMKQKSRKPKAKQNKQKQRQKQTALTQRNYNIGQGQQNVRNNKMSGEDMELVKLLYVQATTIQRLL